MNTDSTAPYSYTINNLLAGNYKFDAKAIDNNGLANSSATVSVSVLPCISNKAPVVDLINPPNNSIYYAPVTTIISATAGDEDGTISNVKFYMGSTLLAVDSTFPYTDTLNDIPAGSYSFSAKATDNNGMESNSATAVVTVVIPPNKAPAVDLTSPVNNSIYTDPATITLNAIASDADGTITNVKFFKGSNVLKTDSTGPYNYILNNVTAGSYKFYAKAFDNNGATNSSATVSVVVKPVAANTNAPETTTNSSIASRGQSSRQIKPAIIEVPNMKLLPNPARNILDIYTTGLFKKKQINVSIISASGVIMKTEQSNSSNQTIRMNISSLVNGVYTVKLISGGNVMRKKFVKL